MDVRTGAQVGLHLRGLGARERERWQESLQLRARITASVIGASLSSVLCKEAEELSVKLAGVGLLAGTTYCAEGA